MHRNLSSPVVVTCLLIFMTSPVVAEESSEPLHLGVVLYEGFELLDVFGPLEMFINVGVERLRIHMVAEEKGPISSSAGGYPPSLALRRLPTTPSKTLFQFLDASLQGATGN